MERNRFIGQLLDEGWQHGSRCELAYVVGSSGVRWTETLVASARYFTKVERPYLLYLSALSSVVWFCDMEFGC